MASPPYFLLRCRIRSSSSCALRSASQWLRPPTTNNDSDSKAAKEERARKLAAMQEAARDLDKDRKQRLAAIEEADRRAQEDDDRIRQRNKKYGGEAMFTNALHSRAAEIKISERMERAG